jgi:lysophospholipase L1-like esterase
VNLNLKAKRVLCYGDSNTWGQKPDKSGRFAVGERWTSLLQSKLGDGFEVIEEGLSSRTVSTDDDQRPGRNGLSYFLPCLLTHRPLDLIVIMLGTNDLKNQFDKSPEQIVKDQESYFSVLGELQEDRLTNDPSTKPVVILVSPIHIVDSRPDFKKFYTGVYDSRASGKSLQLASLFGQLAKDKSALFLDASSVAIAGSDGIHIDQTSQSKLADAIFELVDQAL